MLTRRHLFAALALGFGLGAAYGVAMHRNHLPPYPQLYQLLRAPDDGRPHGRWRATLPTTTAEDVALQRQALEALGYLSGSELPDGPPGVQQLAPERAEGGLRLYTSGEAPVAVLIDAAGNTLHRWERPIADLLQTPVPAHAGFGTYWRRVRLLPDGDLLAIYEGLALVRLDRAAEPRWVIERGAHHDLDVAPDGRIVVLGHTSRVVPRVHPTRALHDDLLLTLSPTGETLSELSLLDALLDSPYAAVLDPLPDGPIVLHANSVQILTGPEAPFGQENLLVSLRDIDTVVVVDPRARRVVWALRGAWRRQHDARWLGDGRLLVFDNQQAPDGTASRVVEIDVTTQRVVWAYTAPGFFSRTCGSAHRLPNGNTLITESDPGRAFEVTPTGEVVWAFRNPSRAGEGEAWVATLFHVDPVAAPPWLAGGER